MHLTVSGIVLKVQPSGDSDRLCTILTDTHGVIYAVARGAKSMKNKNAAATAQFVYAHFELFRRKELYIIDESQPEELYAGLREDIVRLTVAQYICQLAKELVPQEQSAEEYLPLLRAALYYLSENTRPPLLVKAAAELRMMSLAGYMPDLVMCAGCGAYEHDVMFFLPGSAQIRCGNCGSGTGSSVRLCRGALAAMRHAVYSDLRRTFAFTLSDDSLIQMAQASEAFVLTRLEKNLTALAFLHTLLQMPSVKGETGI